MLRFMGPQRVRHDWATDLIWSDLVANNINFSHVYWPFIYIFGYSKCLLVCFAHFNLDFLFLTVNIRSPYIVWILDSWQMHDLQIFFPILWLVFSLSWQWMSFEAKWFKFYEDWLVIFCCCCCFLYFLCYIKEFIP